MSSLMLLPCFALLGFVLGLFAFLPIVSTNTHETPQHDTQLVAPTAPHKNHKFKAYIKQVKSGLPIIEHPFRIKKTLVDHKFPDIVRKWTEYVKEPAITIESFWHAVEEIQRLSGETPFYQTYEDRFGIQALPTDAMRAWEFDLVMEDVFESPSVKATPSQTNMKQ